MKKNKVIPKVVIGLVILGFAATAIVTATATTDVTYIAGTTPRAGVPRGIY